MIYSALEYDYNRIKNAQSVGSRKRKKEGKREYIDIVCSFDIETSKLPFVDDSIMYIWMLQIGPYDTIIGRTWAEFSYFLRNVYRVSGGRWLVIYVHNLAYEFTYLSGIYHFKSEEVFAVKSRRPLTCDMLGCIEYRCSYLHSNKSLAKWSHCMNIAHPKKDGEDLDYYAYRTPRTPLTEENIAYCITDVLAVVECIEKELIQEGDTLETIPLTSTGYVRRELKEALHSINPVRVRSILPDVAQYNLLRWAFRGGDTHASRLWSGELVKQECHSTDRVSSYPDVVLNGVYPITPFKPPRECNIERMLLSIKRGRAVIAHLVFVGIRLRSAQDPAPYIGKSKCRGLRKGEYIEDNGRIISAEYIEIAVTDVDLRIIIEQYEWQTMEVVQYYWAKYGKLPKPVRDVIMNLYIDKTELKGVEGSEYEYMRKKEKLNAGSYGVFAQDPAKPELLYQYTDNEYIDSPEDTIEKMITEYQRKGIMPYQWGVWITANARMELHKMRKCVDDTMLLYWDTDSVKYIGEADFSGYNAEREKLSKESGAFAKDKHGHTHYMGVAEPDGDYRSFITLGAKKYAYIGSEDGKLHITVAGVNKKAGAQEMDGAYEEENEKFYRYIMEWDEDKREYKAIPNDYMKPEGIHSLKVGYTFYKAGGTAMVYNDEIPYERRRFYGSGRWWTVTRNCTIVDSTYKVGMVDEYRALIASQYVQSVKQVIEKNFDEGVFV